MPSLQYYPQFEPQDLVSGQSVQGDDLEKKSSGKGRQVCGGEAGILELLAPFLSI